MKDLSIIVPCYNVENYIDRCMESIALQTLDRDRYEVVLVDDAATDATWDKICEWERKCPDIVIAVHCDRNGKSGAARNIGLKYSSGRYIGYVDSDDWIEPDMYRAMLDAAEKTGAEIVTCGHVRDKGDGTARAAKGNGNVTVKAIDTDKKRRELMVSNALGYFAWDKLVRRSFVEENRISFPEGIRYEDIYYGELLAAYVKKIATINSTFYHYFVNPSSIVLKKNESYHEDIMTSNRLLLEQMIQRGLWDAYREELELDLLFTWYLGTVKVICLRYDEPPYDMFLKLTEEIRTYMPGCWNNPYIKTTMEEFYQLLVQMIPCRISPKELAVIAENFRKIVNAS